MIAIEITKMPEKCDGCKFEDRFGGCVLLNCIGNDYPIEEFDEEWRNARKEGRRLKYCPLTERQTKKDHFADVGKKQPRKAINERVYCKDYKYLMLSDCYGECSKAYRGIVNPDDYCERGNRRKNEQIYRRGQTEKEKEILFSNAVRCISETRTLYKVAGLA